MSTNPTPAYATSTVSSPGPGDGSGSSTVSSESTGPGRLTTTARIEALSLATRRFREQFNSTRET
ncbi:hypothetical protein [Streptomyces sp. NPDC006527]|uniref:hypothetical protein n=1 Tax=Streptomyces sp. NPDC006527 TaxID=3364749 RepID=UPI0036C16587